MERKIYKIVDQHRGRTYEFNLMTAWEGLDIFHKYASIVLTALPQISEAIGKFAAVSEKKDVTVFNAAKSEAIVGGGPFLTILRLVPQIMNGERLKELFCYMLSGAKVNDKTCDSTGMCELFEGDPLEAYAALFWAITANYPKYVDPLLNALSEEGERDGTQDSTTQEEGDR